MRSAVSSSYRFSSPCSVSKSPVTSRRGMQLAAVQRDSSGLMQRLTGAVSTTILAAGLLSVPFAAIVPLAHADNSEMSRRAVDEYLDAEMKGKTKTAKDLDSIRAKFKIRRQTDGRVQLKSSKGDWWSVRLDMEVRCMPVQVHATMIRTESHARGICCLSARCPSMNTAPVTHCQVPGALLLRDNSGNVYAVQTESLQQVRKLLHTAKGYTPSCVEGIWSVFQLHGCPTSA